MLPPVTIRQASAQDVDSIAHIINRAFAVERFFVEGDRTSREEVAKLMTRGVFLVGGDVHSQLIACVYTETRLEGRGYIGLLSVEPLHQHVGHGVRLMHAAEQHLRDVGCHAVDITVVNLRTELPPFYRKLGYAEWKTAPFPDTSRATQPCHFIIMSKPL